MLEFFLSFSTADVYLACWFYFFTFVCYSALRAYGLCIDKCFMQQLVLIAADLFHEVR